MDKRVFDYAQLIVARFVIFFSFYFGKYFDHRLLFTHLTIINTFFRKYVFRYLLYTGNSSSRNVEIKTSNCQNTEIKNMH